MSTGVSAPCWRICGPDVRVAAVTMPSAPGPVLAALAIGGLALGLAAEVSTLDQIGLDRAAADIAVGWVFIGVGLAALGRNGGRRSGLLMVVVGVLWFAGSLWSPALYLHRGALVHLVLGLTDGRRPSLAVPGVVVLAYIVTATEPLAESVPLTIVLALLVVGIGSHRGLAARAPWTATAACGLTATALGLAAGSRGVASFTLGGDAVLAAYEAALIAVAVVTLATLPQIGRARTVVADLVVELGQAVRSPSLREALARALGDPSLQVAYRVESGERYVDEHGGRVDLSRAGPARQVTHVEGEGGRVAALVYDPAAIDDEELLDAVRGAARLSLVNARLYAEVAVQIEELDASRRRVLEAADDERIQLARRLHEGAARRLDVFAGMLGRARDGLGQDDQEAAQRLDAAALELERALADVYALARGLHPRTLTEGGLRAALSELAQWSPLAVSIAVTPERFGAAVEATAYFVCAEALANVGKYAGASRVTCSAELRDGVLRVVVFDDGIGGADPARGTGLRGLVDRVEALGGELRVDSPAGLGTTVAADIPLS